MAKNKGSWDSLPKEIRLMILQALQQDNCSLASLATVSREWQTIIEKHNFARIKVTLSRLGDFGSMLHRNRALVRYIWLCVELPKYGCMDCKSMKPRDLRRCYGTTVCQCVFHDFFSVLSTWESHGSLVLDISFHSPSDPQHWFPGLTTWPDIPSVEECERAFHGTSKPKLAGPEENKHGWTDGSPPRQALYKIAEEIKIDTVKIGPCPLDDMDKEQRRVPDAPAVTGFFLRQQNHRLVDPNEVRRCIFDHCTGLQEIYYEPWREWYDQDQENIDYRYMLAFHRPLPKRLKRLVIFENFDERLALDFTWPYDSIRIPSRLANMEIARNTLRLEHFSGAFIVDATTFLGFRKPEWTWPNLKTIALTSQLLMPEEEEADEVIVGQMLKAAAAAAAEMPNLETMEIWNGDVGIAGLFRYRSARRGRAAGITWKGTWDLALTKDVIQAWEAVRRKEEEAVYGYRRSRLEVAKEVLDARKIRFHGDAIHYLGLEAQVIRPVSLYQMRMERDVWEGRVQEETSSAGES